MRPTSPCKRNDGKCELRGTEVCHTDKCPYGRAEFLRKQAEFREEVRSKKRIEQLMWRDRCDMQETSPSSTEPSLR